MTLYAQLQDANGNTLAIQNTDSGATFPLSQSNEPYRQYLAWVAGGGVPDVIRTQFAFSMASVRPDQLATEIAAQLPTPNVTPQGGTVDQFGLVYSTPTAVIVGFTSTPTSQQQTTLASIVAAHVPAVSAVDKADHYSYKQRIQAAALVLLSTQITRNGTATNGLATITGLAKTSDLAVGMYVSAAAGIQAGTKILTVDSATQITMDHNATGSGTAPVTFGVASVPQHTWAQGQVDGLVTSVLTALGL